ncbi:TetR/AcrR family transcriptional regulator [Bifidobacterium aquikefiricola]|uniref:TetR/AcrR family transcriptional regulator n=1 Tax=Bifidobacterium aquikefiricola TaxID=3059038 RepID=A0AB39U5E0_9BIFI
MPRKNDAAGTAARILDVAFALFIKQGFEQTTVADIVRELGMSKGAIFYHFESKEAILSAVVSRLIDEIADRATLIADDEALTVDEKMREALLTLNISQGAGDKVIDELREPSNARLYQTALIQIIQSIAPLLAKIVQQGVSEGIYTTAYPLETIELLLAADQNLFNSGAFTWTLDELTARVRAFIRMIELTLGAQEGSFDMILNNLDEQSERMCREHKGTNENTAETRTEEQAEGVQAKRDRT